MTKDEALRLALEALESTGENNGYHGVTQYFDETMVDQAITAIKAALLSRSDGEAKDEPVAWQYRDANDDGTWSAWTGCDKRLTESDWRKVRPLYTTPPPVAKPHKRTLVGLTEAECGVLWKVNMTPFDYYQAIEAKLKEKNGYA